MNLLCREVDIFGVEIVCTRGTVLGPRYLYLVARRTKYGCVNDSHMEIMPVPEAHLVDAFSRSTGRAEGVEEGGLRSIGPKPQYLTKVHPA